MCCIWMVVVCLCICFGGGRCGLRCCNLYVVKVIERCIVFFMLVLVCQLVSMLVIMVLFVLIVLVVCIGGRLVCYVFCVVMNSVLFLFSDMMICVMLCVWMVCVMFIVLVSVGSDVFVYSFSLCWFGLIVVGRDLCGVVSICVSGVLLVFSNVGMLWWFSCVSNFMQVLGCKFLVRLLYSVVFVMLVNVLIWLYSVLNLVDVVLMFGRLMLVVCLFVWLLILMLV